MSEPYWVPVGGSSGMVGTQGPAGPQGPIGPEGPSGGAPAGFGCVWFSNTPPSGWAILDGSTLTNAQTTYPDLWANVDPVWKSGSNIILPDCRGRTPVGKGTHADVDALGDNDGAALAARRIKHKHVVNDPTHGHPGNSFPTAGGTASAPISRVADLPRDSLVSYQGLSIAAAATGITVGPQTGNEPTDGPSYLTVNWMIKLANS